MATIIQKRWAMGDSAPRRLTRLPRAGVHRSSRSSLGVTPVFTRTIMCVEACPCDAIRMDSGTHPGNLGFTRKDFVETKEVLMERSKELAEKGKEGLYEKYVKPYRHV